MLEKVGSLPNAIIFHMVTCEPEDPELIVIADLVKEPLLDEAVRLKKIFPRSRVAFESIVGEFEDFSVRRNVMSRKKESIHMSYGEVLDGHEEINKLLSAAIPARAAYWLGRNAAELHRAFKKYEEERRKLVMKYGDPDHALKSVTVPESRREQFQADLDKVRESSIDLEIYKIDLSEFNDVPVPVGMMQICSFMFLDNGILPYGKGR